MDVFQGTQRLSLAANQVVDVRADDDFTVWKMDGSTPVDLLGRSVEGQVRFIVYEEAEVEVTFRGPSQWIVEKKEVRGNQEKTDRAGS